MDFPDIFNLGAYSEYIRVVDSTHPQVKGKDFLLGSLREYSNCLKVCKIEDEIISSGIDEWTSRLERKYIRGRKIKKEDSEDLSIDAERWQNLIDKELIYLGAAVVI